MSEFAFDRFLMLGWLTPEEKESKEEIIEATEEVLQQKGQVCDETIAKLSEEALREIFEQVRLLRERKKKKRQEDITGKREEVAYIR